MTNQSISRYPVPKLADLPQDMRERIEKVQEKAGFIPNVFLSRSRTGRPSSARSSTTTTRCC